MQGGGGSENEKLWDEKFSLHMVGLEEYDFVFVHE